MKENTFDTLRSVNYENQQQILLINYKNYFRKYWRGVFRTLSSIYDEAILNYFHQAES